MHPQVQTVEAVLKEFDVQLKEGLTDQQIAHRKLKYGPNIIVQAKARSEWSIFLAQFKNSIVFLLMVASMVSFFFGEMVESMAILAVILINAIIGYILESQANRSMATLKSLEQPNAKVIRNGLLMDIPMQELVPGDLLSFEAGDLIGADARLITMARLEINESPLTGESVPVSKQTIAFESEVGLGDQSNMVFRGTSVTKGNGLAVVAFTGQQTEIGQIASMVDEAQAEEIPLNQKLNTFSKMLIWLTIIIIIPFLSIGIFQSKDLNLLVETAIALAVAAIPEGLPIVATIALASGMLRLSKKKVLVRKLAAVETLGGTNVILTDKTGTLTENKLEVDQIVLSNNTPSFSSRLNEVMVLCNNAAINDSHKEVGDPVEIALLKWIQEKEPGSISLIRNQWVKLAEFPFESETRMMSTLHRNGSLFQVSVKGAVADILRHCKYYELDGEKRALNTQHINYWLERTESLSKQGLKVLAFAYQTLNEPVLQTNHSLTILGLVGLLDPARPEVSLAIAECKNAGIKVVMVTGDHPETARTIALSIGLTKDQNDVVVHGQDLDFSEKGQNSLKLLEASIFSRVTPEQKLRLVELYQSKGYVVAMTGDGVNDAPALKKADIGIAMGLRGTQVAKEAADMVLQDDSFSSIVTAIKQGRIIFNNIRNFVFYLLSCNLSEIMVVSLAAFFNLGSPLLPLQILFLNLVTDVFPALALGMGQGNKKLILQQARALSEPILTKRHWKSIIVYALIITISILGAFLFALKVKNYNNLDANNVAFFTLAFAQLVHPFNLIKRGESLLGNGIVKNLHLWASILFCSLLLLGASMVSPFDQLLNLQSISFQLLPIILVGSIFPLLLIHTLKLSKLLD
ncbi:cation-translocating P-type ATPase [Roseivirga echinicomitans]|uniref:Cation-transporting P-type ATPase N-terminal domain-containing protein n=1 Tax=Roseivirga echinicomitans TaxID=296218 RepID=A0A150XV26_9BACT|nr:cation-translocating P-type ATPase [Roseivirga echinicomitans]KYG82485.1 hypothetical protein AWN68_14620 [Roseivirga echinicomitans]